MIKGQHKSRRENEVVRLRDRIENLRGLLSGLEMALEHDAPIGDAGQSISISATGVVIAAARFDAFLLAEIDAKERR